LWDFLGERYGFAPWEIARMHPTEINRYLSGAESREEKKKRAQERGSTPSADQQRREQQALEKYK
jgi:hypothetical protein